MSGLTRKARGLATGHTRQKLLESSLSTVSDAVTSPDQSLQSPGKQSSDSPRKHPSSFPPLCTRLSPLVSLEEVALEPQSNIPIFVRRQKQIFSFWTFWLPKGISVPNPGFPVVQGVLWTSAIFSRKVRRHYYIDPDKASTVTSDRLCLRQGKVFPN